MEPLAWLPRLDPVWTPSPGPAAAIQGKEAGPARWTLDGKEPTVSLSISLTVSVSLASISLSVTFLDVSYRARRKPKFE